MSTHDCVCVEGTVSISEDASYWTTSKYILISSKILNSPGRMEVESISG